MASENIEESSMQRQHTKDEEDDYNDSEDEEDCQNEKKARQAITGRSVTLSTLMEDKIIEAGEGALSIDYLGQRFVADLLTDGKIRSQETTEIFNTPSAWAIFCKKLVNPAKKSGCGWASVKYKGRKLDTWKMAWCRKQRPNSPYRGNSPFRGTSPYKTDSPHHSASPGVASSSENGYNGESSRVNTPKLGEELRNSSPLPAHSHTSLSNGASSLKRPFYSFFNEDVQEEALNLSLSGPLLPKENQPKRNSVPDNVHMPGSGHYTCRPSIKYTALGKRSNDRDPNTLIECENFGDYGKIQPFTVSITSNALLIMDFHSHLTSSEVVGYLGGRWETQSQHVTVLEAFSCRCRLGDKDRAPGVEDEIRRTMSRSGLQLVGWYHSHPHCQPDPSLKDLDCQMTYQLRMKGTGSSYHPCLGFIVSPYDVKPDKNEAVFQAYWVMPPADQHESDYGVPMNMKYTVYQNPMLSEDLLTEMKKLVDFYKGAPDRVRFKENWVNAKPFLDKIKDSLSARLPQDLAEKSSFLEYVQQLLVPV